MKRIISIILVIVLCLTCCFALTACSDDEDNEAVSRREEMKNAESAKLSFSAVMESYNGYVTIKGSSMDITDNTTIQDVIDFLRGEGQIVTVDHLDTSLAFIEGCQQHASGLYVIKDGVEWHKFYIK